MITETAWELLEGFEKLVDNKDVENKSSGRWQVVATLATGGTLVPLDEWFDKKEEATA